MKLRYKSYVKWNDNLDKVKMNEEAFSSRILGKKILRVPPTGVEPITFQNTDWTLLPMSYGRLVTHKNLVYDLAHHESPIAQWLERPTDILEDHRFDSRWRNSENLLENASVVILNKFAYLSFARD